MLWDEMTEAEKRKCYTNYISNFNYEWNECGDDNAMTFEEYDKEWSGNYYEPTHKIQERWCFNECY